jgi:hypothetical protein
MKLAFDVDGVVLRSIEVILDHVNGATGRKISPSDLFTWDLDPLQLSPNVLREAVDYLYAMKSVDPYKGAVETLEKIYEETQRPLLFITGRSDPITAKRQLEALSWNRSVPEMIVIGGSRDKRAFLRDVNANFIIEDDEMHLGDYLSSGVGVGLMLQPWNRNCKLPVNARFDGWSEIEVWFTKNLQQGFEPIR